MGTIENHIFSKDSHQSWVVPQHTSKSIKKSLVKVLGVYGGKLINSGVLMSYSPGFMDLSSFVVTASMAYVS
eukprot:5705975-Ditylum_brightwellii.AAC.1